MKSKPKANYCYQEANDAKALFVFAHGAGADMTHSFMNSFTQLLLLNNISVLRFNFPYMDKRATEGKRYPPDRMPKLVECYLDVLLSIETELPLFIGGKSMGSRVASTISSDKINNLRGVICLGYPFHPAKKPENLRLDPLFATLYPTLILQGDRDLLGNKEEVLSYKLPSLNQCVFLPDGDHDLKPRVKSGVTHQTNLQFSVNEISRFIDEKSNNS